MQSMEIINVAHYFHKINEHKEANCTEERVRES